MQIKNLMLILTLAFQPFSPAAFFDRPSISSSQNDLMEETRTLALQAKEYRVLLRRQEDIVQKLSDSITHRQKEREQCEQLTAALVMRSAPFLQSLQRENDVFMQAKVEQDLLDITNCRQKADFEKRSIILMEISVQKAESEIEKLSTMLDEISTKMEEINTKLALPEVVEGGAADPEKGVASSDRTPFTGGPSGGVSFGMACPADESYRVDGSGEWVLPADGWISAGTWSYPDGSMHLGMDLGLDMYTPLAAPLNGLVLYADAPVDSDGGYPGNWSGWPYGGGNTLLLLCKYEDEVYAISFFHLSNRLSVRSGQSVKASDRIALSGNSGNTTGPHTHIEVFRITSSFEEAREYFARTSDFSFGCGWDSARTCSSLACRIRPESVFDF